MKKILIILVSILSFSLYAQAPQGLNYQATVRNSSGNLITNQNVYFRFNIMQNSATSVPVYTETHYVPTDDLGQVNCVIGQGTATTGTFSQIDWSNGTYFLGIELNIGLIPIIGTVDENILRTASERGTHHHRGNGDFASRARLCRCARHLE